MLEGSNQSSDPWAAPTAMTRSGRDWHPRVQKKAAVYGMLFAKRLTLELTTYSGVIFLPSLFKIFTTKCAILEIY